MTTADISALRAAFNSSSIDTVKCHDLLTSLKVAYASKLSMSNDDEQAWIDTLEMAAFLYVRANDFPLFERGYSQISITPSSLIHRLQMTCLLPFPLSP